MTKATSTPAIDKAAIESALPMLFGIIFGGKRGPGVPGTLTGNHLKYMSLLMWGITTFIVAVGPIAGFLGIDTTHIEPEHIYAAIAASILHTGAAVAHSASKAGTAARAVAAAQSLHASTADGSVSYETVTKEHRDILKNPYATPAARIKLTDYGQFSSNLKRTVDGDGKSRFTLPSTARFLVFEYPDVKDYMTGELCRKTPSGLERLELKFGASHGDGTSTRVKFLMMERDPSTRKDVPMAPGSYTLIAEDDVGSDDNTTTKNVVDFDIAG